MMQRVSVIAFLIVVALTSCGSSVADEPAAVAEVASAEDRVGPLQWTAERNANLDRVVPFRDLPGLVASVVALHNDEAFVGEERVVRGRFVAVKPGPGVRWDGVEGEGNPTQVEVDANASDAEIVTYELDFEVLEQIAPHPAERTLGTEKLVTLRIGFIASPGTGLDLIERDFLALPDVVLFLTKSPVFAYDKELWGVMADGELIAVVEADQSLTFPASIDPELFTGGQPATLSSLVDAAERAS